MDKNVILLEGSGLKAFVKTVEQNKQRYSAALMKELKRLLK